MARERKELDRRWLWLGAAVLLVIVFFTARALTRDRLPVRVAQAARGQLSSTMSTNGRVEPDQNFEYVAPSSGSIRSVNVQEGDQVPAGKVLIALDDMQARARLATAESAVKAAQAALEAALHNGTQEQRQASAAELTRNKVERDRAQTNLNALVKLQTTGAASASEVAAARQQLQEAEAALRASEQNSTARYSSAEIERDRAAVADAEANAAAARDALAKTVYRAPVAGTVYSLDAKVSEYSEEGKPLLELADLKHQRVRAYFDEPEIGRLAVGQPILIKWDAKPGREWHGHIVRTPVTVTTYTTRTVGEVLIEIDGDVDGLLPATNVTVTVTTANETNVLTIPREALFTENGKTYVFKVDGNELKRTPVTVGAFNLTQAAILSGLNEGDTVATGTTTGQPMQAGVPIKVVQ